VLILSSLALGTTILVLGSYKSKSNKELEADLKRERG